MTAVTIAGQVAAMADAYAGQPPEEVMGVFAREQAELAAGGIPEAVIAAGAVLPDADLLDRFGAPATLHHAIGDQPAVVVLYRGAWCPYCNITLRTYQSELLPELTRRGVALVAISPQRPDGSLTMQEKNDLTFTVLSDPGNQVARAAGVLAAPSSQVRATQLQLGLDLRTVNADGTAGVPMPTTMIIDAHHVVGWIDVHPDYSTRSEPGQILTALEVTALDRTGQ
jgi:peroxiredoxin